MTKRLDVEEFGPTAERRAFRHQLLTRLTQQKMSAAELARKSGVSKDAISSYKTMRSLPNEETLAKLARALKCKPEQLQRAMEEADEDSPLIEIREYSKPGYKLLVARLPVPIDAVGELFSKLSQYAETKKR